jgi:3'-phosphoadenosine 5'-phosphosulfate sulfotransferase (PAPS reductase)/FAD synthetase
VNRYNDNDKFAAQWLRNLIRADLIPITGQRGNQDDALRGMRSIKDETIKFIKQDKLYIINSLDGWTDTMIRRYTEQNKLKTNPLKEKGAITIGCMLCGGGAQFTNSGFKILRKLNKRAWRKFIVEQRAGEVILAIKYNVHIDVIRAAIKKLGGLEYLANKKPYIFDFLLQTPIQGYNK